MYLDVDLDIGNLIVSSPGLRNALSSASFKFDTDEPVRVRFWSDGVQVELAGTSVTGAFGIKLKGKYDGDLLVEATEWTKVGEGDSTYYEFSPSFNTEAISTAILEGDGNTDNDLDFVDGMLEVKWVIDGKKHRTLNSPQTLVYNSILKPEDNTPLAKADPAAWLLGSSAPVNAETGPNIIVSGAGSTVLNGEYEPAGLNVGKTRFNKVGVGASIRALWNGLYWLLEESSGPQYFSADDVATPDLVTTWQLGSGGAQTPFPTVEFEETEATAAPPYLRVHGGFLYIQEAGVWKKTALSAL